MLRNNSLASIKPEISQALESLLDELRSIEGSKVLRTFSPRYTSKKCSFKSCILCKTAGRTGSSSHGLVDCKYLPEFDKRSLARSRMVCDNIDEQDSYTGDEGYVHETMPQDSTANIYQNLINVLLLDLEWYVIILMNRIHTLAMKVMSMRLCHKI